MLLKVMKVRLLSDASGAQTPHVLELPVLLYESLANKTAGRHYMHAIKGEE